jgi:hypothetical protein
MGRTRRSGILTSAGGELTSVTSLKETLLDKHDAKNYTLLNSSWWFHYTRWLGYLGLRSGIITEYGKVGFCFIAIFKSLFLDSYLHDTVKLTNYVQILGILNNFKTTWIQKSSRTNVYNALTVPVILQRK